MRGSGIKRGGIPSRLPIVLGAILSASALARAEDWKREVSHDGKATVEYRVSRIGDDAGEERPLIEFKASLIDSAGYERCLSVMLDVSKHKIINDDEASETIRRLSETEWILYYEVKIPWPLPKTDCVMRMRLSKDSADKSAEFALTAAPELAPSRGKRRFRIHRFSYTLKDLGNGKVALGVAGKSSPPFKVPLWMIRAGFPEAASDPLRKIVKLANAGP
jgi:hypothetical protein